MVILSIILIVLFVISIAMDFLVIKKTEEANEKFQEYIQSNQAVNDEFSRISENFKELTQRQVHMDGKKVSAKEFEAMDASIKGRLNRNLY